MHHWSTRTCLLVVSLAMGCSGDDTESSSTTAAQPGLDNQGRDIESSQPAEGPGTPTASSMATGMNSGLEHKQGTALIMLNQDVHDEPQPRQSQDEILQGDHVTLTGTLVCSGCSSETYVARIGPFTDPAQNSMPGVPPQPITSVKLDTTGAFSIAVPTSDTPIVLEVLADRNGDGLPSQGDRIAVHHEAGKLIPSANITGLQLNLTVSQESPLIAEDLAPGLRGTDDGSSTQGDNRP